MAKDTLNCMVTMPTNRWFPVSLFFGGSFLLHLLWENLQAPLYEGFESFGQHFWICFQATRGDFLFMLIIYAALTVVHRDLFWVANRSSYAHPATWIMTLLIGVLLAVSSELRAVYVTEQWQYSPSMPLLPILSIGLTPVLQIIAIPLITLSISRFASRL